MLYLSLQFIVKDATQEQPNGRDAQGKVMGRGGTVQSFQVLSRLAALPTYACVHQLSSSLDPVIPGILWKFHYKGMKGEKSRSIAD